MSTLYDSIPALVKLALADLDLVHLQQWKQLVELHSGNELEALKDVLHQGLGPAVNMRDRQAATDTPSVGQTTC